MADTKNTSVCLLQLPDGRLVFQRRTKDAPVSAHNLSPFGGHLEGGESALHAVKRELSEETSLNPEHLRIKYIGSFMSQAIKGSKMSLYTAHISGPEFKVYEGEAEETYSLQEALARTDLDPDLRQLLIEYQKVKD